MFIQRNSDNRCARTATESKCISRCKDHKGTKEAFLSAIECQFHCSHFVVSLLFYLYPLKVHSGRGKVCVAEDGLSASVDNLGDLQADERRDFCVELTLDKVDQVDEKGHTLTGTLVYEDVIGGTNDCEAVGAFTFMRCDTMTERDEESAVSVEIDAQRNRIDTAR